MLWAAQRPHEGPTDASSWWVLAAYPTRLECESRRGVLHRQRSSDDASYECPPDTVARAEGEVVGGRVDRLLGTRNQTCDPPLRSRPRSARHAPGMGVHRAT